MTYKTMHATTVSQGGRGVLIVGESQSGKSLLALQLLERGCALVSDDITILRAREGRVYACAPAGFEGCLEVRSLGILEGLPQVQDVPVHVVLSLCAHRPPRLPARPSFRKLAGVSVPCFKLYAAGSALASQALAVLRVASGELSLRTRFLTSKEEK